MFRRLARWRLESTLTPAQMAAVKVFRQAYKNLDKENRRSGASDQIIEDALSCGLPIIAQPFITAALQRLQPLEEAFRAAKEQCHKEEVTDDKLKILVGSHWVS